MVKPQFVNETKLTVKGIEGFMIRKVTPFGNGAKVDCLKEHIGKNVYVIVLKD